MKFLQKNPSLSEIKVYYLLSSQFLKDGSRNTDISALEHRWKNGILGFQQYSNGEGCLAAYKTKQSRLAAHFPNQMRVSRKLRPKT